MERHYMNRVIRIIFIIYLFIIICISHNSAFCVFSRLVTAKFPPKDCKGKGILQSVYFQQVYLVFPCQLAVHFYSKLFVTHRRDVRKLFMYLFTVSLTSLTKIPTLRCRVAGSWPMKLCGRMSLRNFSYPPSTYMKVLRKTKGNMS
jgi:hypothetical protein